ncbi:MAG: SLC13 family permease, partial [Bacillota bacterium]
AEQASALQNRIFINATIFYTLAFLIFYFILGGYKVKAVTLDKPERFTKEQATSLILVASIIILYLVPTILNLLIPNNPTITLIKSKADFLFFALVGVVLGFMMKLNTEKEIFNKTSWSTLLMISGMGMLVAVGEQAGIIEQISAHIASNVSSKLIPQMIAAASGVLSYVSDGPAVVYPTLYPLVAKIADLTGTDPGILFTAISIGDSTTVISPFSTGGAMYLTFISDAKERNKLFTQFLIAPF